MESQNTATAETLFPPVISISTLRFLRDLRVEKGLAVAERCPRIARLPESKT